jgi:hypothetical protein
MARLVAPTNTHVIMSHYLISRLSPVVPLVIFIITFDAKAVNRAIVHQIHVATMTNRKPASVPELLSAGLLPRPALLLLVVNPHQHANEFARNLAMMLVQSLQICN